jgi:hypothetical protein
MGELLAEVQQNNDTSEYGLICLLTMSNLGNWYMFGTRLIRDLYKFSLPEPKVKLMNW